MWRWSQEKKKSNVLSQMSSCPCQGEGSGGRPRGPSASQDPRSQEMPEGALCHARSLHTRAGLGSGGFVHAILAEVMECVEDECAISRWDPGAKIGVISLPSGQKQPEATAW